MLSIPHILMPLASFGLIAFLIFSYFSDRRWKVKMLQPLAKALNGKIERTFFGRISLLIPQDDSEVRITLMNEEDSRVFPIIKLFIRTPFFTGPKIVNLTIEQEVESGFTLWIQPRGMAFNYKSVEIDSSHLSGELGDKEFDEKYQIWTGDRFEAQDFLVNEGRIQAADFLFDNKFNFICLRNNIVFAQKADSEPKDMEPNQMQSYVGSLTKFITG